MVTTAELKNEVQSLCQQPCSSGLGGSSCSGGFGGSGSGGSSNSSCSCCINTDGYFTDAFGNNVSMSNYNTAAIVPIKACTMLNSNDAFAVSIKGLSFPCNNACDKGGLCATFSGVAGAEPPPLVCCIDRDLNPCVPHCSRLEENKFCSIINMTNWSQPCSDNVTAIGIKCTDPGRQSPGCCMSYNCYTYPSSLCDKICHYYTLPQDICVTLTGKPCFYDSNNMDIGCIIDAVDCPFGGFYTWILGTTCPNGVCHDNYKIACLS